MDEEDYNKLLNYVSGLMDLWLNTIEEDFPLDATKEPLGWVAPLGFPRTSYWAYFNNRDELWGRIQMLGQLLNAESLNAITKDGEVIEVKL